MRGHRLASAGLVTLSAVSSLAAEGEIRGNFVTTLGSDTVAIESYVRTHDRLEGDIVLRVPGTTRFHYKLTFLPDGSVKTSSFEIKPLSSPPTEEQRRLAIDFDRGTMHLVSTRNGDAQIANRPIDGPANVWFLGGYGSSFGIYGSYGMYEYLLSRVKVGPETTTMSAVSASTGELSKRLFRRPSATSAEVDYFRMAWIQVTLDSAGLITSADAAGTTERTITKRVDTLDVAGVEKEFIALDKAKRGLGVASPNVEAKASVGNASVVIKHGSPRMRGRTGAMDVLVKAGKVWRTGANEATTLETNRDLVIGGQDIPAGKYTLWTLPGTDGVQLIINKQTGQWGTEYKSAQDLVRVPMKVAMSDAPVENFTILVQRVAGGSELQIKWDTFVWSVSVAAASR